MFSKKEKIALFLVHGFTDNVKSNFSDLIDYVESKSKINCIAYDLQGHSELEDIDSFDYKKCISKVEKEYLEVQKNYDKVYLLGFSMGGVIASHLASKYSCSKLVLIAPAFKYIEKSGLAKNLFDIIGEDIKSKGIFNLKNKEKLEEYINNKYGDEKVVFRKYFDGTLSTSIKSYINFILLVDKLDKNILIEDTPSRIYIGECDELVPVKAALKVYRNITSKDKMLKVMPHVYHELLHSSLKQELQKEILQFLKKKEYALNRRL